MSSLGAKTKHLTPAQVREMADRLLEETAHRGFFVRLAAASAVSELRAIANRKDRDIRQEPGHGG